MAEPARPGTAMPMSMSAMIHSMKVSSGLATQARRGHDLTQPTSSSSHGHATSSAPSSSKQKKLSDKGRAKLAEHRGRERFFLLQDAAEQQYAELHPELIDANGEIEMPPLSELMGDGIEDEDRLAALISEERTKLENEEMVRKLNKLQRKHNVMQNAQRRGNKLAANYDRDEVDLKVVQKQLKKSKQEEAQREIVLDEPLPLIKDALDAAALGQRPLYAYLEQESVLRDLAETDPRYLRASIDATLERRPSHLNFRAEIVWRLACTLQEWRRGHRETNLRLARHCYVRLIEQCDPEVHPFQYASLQHSLELTDNELDRTTAYTIINRSNRDFEFAEPADPSTNFNFERKHKEKELEKKKKKS